MLYWVGAALLGSCPHVKGTAVDTLHKEVVVANVDDESVAIIQASVSRLRPVTMASLTTVFGMIPLLFDDMFSAMAATITGGLLVGTVIVLFLIPVLYSLFFKTR